MGERKYRRRGSPKTPEEISVLEKKKGEEYISSCPRKTVLIGRGRNTSKWGTYQKEKSMYGRKEGWR